MPEIIEMSIELTLAPRKPTQKVTFRVPQEGSLPQIAKQVKVDKDSHQSWLKATGQPASGIFLMSYPENVDVSPILAGDHNSISVGNPKTHAGIMLFWIKERQEWVVLYRQEFGSSTDPEITVWGPFSSDEFCAEKIKLAFRITDDSTFPTEILKMPPDELAYIGKIKK